MKTNVLLRSAVATALLGTVGVASAATLPGALTATNVLPISGATATDRVLTDVYLDAARGICQDFAQTSTADVTDVFTTETTFGTLSSPQKYENYAVACRARVSTGGLSIGQTYLMLKYSGGSGSGIARVADGSVLAASGSAKWVNALNTAACSAPVNQGGTASGLVRYRLYTNCTSAGSLAPKAGITDVENVLLGATPTQQSRLTQSKTVGVVFAPAVSRNFFVALQNAQGINTTTCGTTGLTSQSTAECLPSLTSGQLRGLFNGTTADTAFFTKSNGTAINGPTSGDTTIHICRRSNTSGTQISFQTYFLGQGCGTAGQVSTLTFVAGDTAGGTAWTTTAQLSLGVFSGTGAADVVACLNAHDDAGNYAIGTLSTENAYDDTNAEHRFIKVDGSAPSLENVVASKYSFFTENQLQVPSGLSPNTVSTDQSRLISATQQILATPALVARAAVTHTYGLGGLLAIPDGSTNFPSLAPFTQANVLANPVNSMVRSSAVGGDSNSCVPPSLLENTGSVVPPDVPAL